MGQQWLYLHPFTALADVKAKVSQGFADVEKQLRFRVPAVASLLKLKTNASASAEQGYTAGGCGRH